VTATAFDRPPRVVLNCQACGAIDRQSIAAARGLGWRIWDGQTMGGKDQSVRLCPRCMAGEKPAIVGGGWDATCDTCDALMSEDEDQDTDEITEDDAESWCSNHICDSEGRTVPPHGKAT
jgi:hypothetical protein